MNVSKSSRGVGSRITVADTVARKIGLRRAAEMRVLYLESDNTTQDYLRTYERFWGDVGEAVCIDDVTEGDVMLFLNRMKEVPWRVLKSGEKKMRKPKTLDNMWIALSSLWTWALERGYVRENVVRLVPRPKVNEEPIIPLTTDEVLALFRACEYGRTYHNDPFKRNRRLAAARDKALVALMVETGLRVSEVVNLRVDDVVFARAGGRVHVHLGKGKKSRYVPFQRRCARMLTEWRAECELEPWFFYNVRRNVGMQMLRKNVAGTVSALGKRAGIAVSPHKLRTTAFCMMVKNGMTAWQLKEIAGHSDIRTTQRYVRAAEIDLEGAMRRASPLDSVRM